jgi:uncharacterized membrane protein
MAGIGFEIKKILKEKTILSLIKSYSYAGMISSGPWLISMISIFIAGFITYNLFNDTKLVIEFTILITYLIALSLIITSFLQLSFTRYLADKIFEKEIQKVFPNTIGAVFVSIVAGAVFIIPWSISIYHEKNLLCAFLFFINFIIYCGIWIVNIVLSGLKNYKAIIFSFFVSYTVIVVLILLFAKHGLNYILLSFLIGEVILFLSLLYIIKKNYHINKFIEFDFLKKNKMYKSLIFIGFFLTASVWVDKFIFWYMPQTSSSVLGMFRYSPIYDFPIFLAYLAIAPGMAMFLLRIETDFVEYYHKYFDAVRTTGTLNELYFYGNEMIKQARFALIEILRIQILTTLVIVLFSEQIFNFFHMPKIYLHLFYVDMIGTSLQLFFMSVVTVLFYLDKRKEILFLAISVFILNAALTLLSIKFGVFYYGYGFGLAFFISSLMAIVFLNKTFKRLHYETFMLN